MKDVIIVGGGIVGLCCAWHLSQSGREVTILDQGGFTDGCSYGNAGMIVPSHFTPLASPGMIAEGMRWMFKSKSPFYIKPRFDLDLLKWLWLFYQNSNQRHVAACAPILHDMHEESKSIYKNWSELPGFSFDLEEKGILMLYKTAKGEKHELEAAEKAEVLGIEANVLDENQISVLDQTTKYSVRGAVHYPGDATFSPDVFMNQMIVVLKNRGVLFIPKTTIAGMRVIGKNECELKAVDGKIYPAKNVVIANGAWSGKLLKAIGFKLSMQGGKGYSMTIENPVQAPAIPALLMESRVSVTPMGNRLRIGGTLEISGLDKKIREAKIQWIKESVPQYYPQFSINTTQPVWYGYRPCTPDGMPLIKRLEKDSPVVIATGHSMMGVSLAPATGRIISDLLKSPRG